MSEVKLKIDIKNGTIDIEAQEENFGDVVDKASLLLDKFSKAASAVPIAESAPSAAPPAASLQSGEQEPTKAKKKKSLGTKSANWKMVDGMLDEEQRSMLKKFFAEKSPQTQNEQVAVLAIKLKELTGLESFDGDQIHTAFQIVDRKTPANLMAVFGNMTGVGLGTQADKKFVPNFKASDFVKHDLPKKAVEK